MVAEKAVAHGGVNGGEEVGVAGVVGEVDQLREMHQGGVLLRRVARGARVGGGPEMEGVGFPEGDGGADLPGGEEEREVDGGGIVVLECFCVSVAGEGGKWVRERMYGVGEGVDEERLGRHVRVGEVEGEFVAFEGAEGGDAIYGLARNVLDEPGRWVRWWRVVG